MSTELLAAYEREWEQARRAQAEGNWDRAMKHLERAHILGQRFTWLHARAHVGMLAVAWRRRRMRDAGGQLSRLVAALVFSKLWVPLGNTGGSDVSAFRPMPIPEDLAVFLGSAPIVTGERADLRASAAPSRSTHPPQHSPTASTPGPP